MPSDKPDLAERDTASAEAEVQTERAETAERRIENLHGDISKLRDLFEETASERNAALARVARVTADYLAERKIGLERLTEVERLNGEKAKLNGEISKWDALHKAVIEQRDDALSEVKRLKALLDADTDYQEYLVRVAWRQRALDAEAALSSHFRPGDVGNLEELLRYTTEKQVADNYVLPLKRAIAAARSAYPTGSAKT